MADNRSQFSLGMALDEKLTELCRLQNRETYVISHIRFLHLQLTSPVLSNARRHQLEIELADYNEEQTLNRTKQVICLINFYVFERYSYLMFPCFLCCHCLT